MQFQINLWPAAEPRRYVAERTSNFHVIVGLIVMLSFVSMAHAESEAGEFTDVFRQVATLSSDASDETLAASIDDARQLPSDGRLFLSSSIVFATQSGMTNACSELKAQGVESWLMNPVSNESEPDGFQCFVFEPVDSESVGRIIELWGDIKKTALQFSGQPISLSLFAADNDSSM